MKQLNTLFQKAENNDADAQYGLAIAYETILAHEENSSELAEAWKQRAKDNGHKLAQEELGVETAEDVPAVVLAV